ncbi:fibulin-7 isoform 3-T3 [Clarias gariepinus]
MMYSSGIFVIIFMTCQMLGSQSQECMSRQEVQSTLQYVHKLLSAHETSFLQSVRSLRKKLNLMHNGTVKHSSSSNTGKNSTLVDAGTHNIATSSMPTSTSPSSPPPASAYVRRSHCIELEGSMQCTCEQGYSISSQDRGLCTDIDECELFRMTQTGRLCMHTCINTAGSYYCQCPTGYSVNKDNRSCQDVNECERGTHNCTKEQECVNTFGGYRCMVVECPRFRNASYIKTSPLQCERNPCVQRNKACLQAPVSISFHFMSVVSNMSTPRVLFRVSAARVVGNTLRFALLGNRGERHFTVQRASRQSGELLLVEPVQGPATLEAEVEMSELERRTLLGRYLTKVTLFVSPYSF